MLVDVYDALTTKRVYKDAFTHEAVIKIIREKHFDPLITDQFIKVESKFNEIRSQFALA